MGEVVLSSEGGTELLQDVAEMNHDGSGSPVAAAEVGASSSLVRWERFLPKLVVRVLLVEADDSTRQIITALLRKCSYKVAAVSDGLKAWEVLKSRAQNIDLILTEVDLPSISGYALLTLIMEHNICKNIPVIMMSSHDSVSIVYKCMMRGAADFLVKPIRKNELRNLWQHVWRKQASIGAGPGPPDENMAQQKIEATAENNATSNHSSGYMACIQRNRECIEKGTDAQSSCTKPELENDGPDVEQVHSLPQPKINKFLSDDVNIYAHKECQEESRKTRAHDNEAGELQNVAKMGEIYGANRGQDKNSWEQVNVTGKNSENNHAREAIDLIGAFGNCCKGTLDSPASNTSTNKFDISPQLDLSLRRSHPSGSVNQVNDETRRINHSDASAFSRYVNKPFQPRNSTSPSTCNQQKDLETNSEKQQSNHTPEYNSDAHVSRISSQKYASATGILAGLPEATFSYPHLREPSQPIPVRGVRFENVTNGFGAMMPQIYCAQSSLSPLPSPGTASHSQSFTYLNPFHPSDRQPTNSQNFQNLLDQRISCTMDQNDNKQGQKLESLEDRGRVSFANDQSPNSGFYSGYTSHHHSTGSGDNGKINSMSAVKATSDPASEEGLHVHETASHRSMQREVALTKFRLKRKERCFEKKVRYESRRKLAEQRPRVKGQFVRQMPDEPQPGSSSPVIHEKTPKHCAEKQATTLHKLNKKLLFYISTFFLTILSLILLIWFTLHPRNPHFSLKQADINHLNSSIHLTLLSTNPNNKVGIYYDGFLIHASYNTHTIAPQTSIPSFYQHHEESNLLTASFPLSPSLAYHDQATRKLALDFMVTGRLRWKLGSWISRRYQFKLKTLYTAAPPPLTGCRIFRCHFFISLTPFALVVDIFMGIADNM